VETDLLQHEQRLYEQLCNPHNLWCGFLATKKNKGAPGIDGQTLADFEAKLKTEIPQLSKELASWTYKPQPVRRVEIDKPDGGVRLLGIPTVRDRVVHSAIKILLEPYLIPRFSKHSYGFMPWRNQQQAVAAAQRIVQSGKEWVVDIDLSKFFDRINHDRLIMRLSLTIKDTRILRLIGEILRCGIMENGLLTASNEGSVQGSPLSPLLSNVVLDELDKELERKGLEFCRFADDCNIFVRTPKAAERVMKNTSKFIEKKLKLKVNQEKSQVARSEKVKFLGMTIINGHVAISAKSMQRAMDKVKALTPRGTHLTLGKTMAKINQWFKGWSSYYSMTQYPAQFGKIEAHIRRRIRARLVDQQKSRRNLYRKLMKRKVPRKQAAKAAYSHDKRWALSRCRAVEKAYPNRWFTEEVGQFIRSKERRATWFDVTEWIRLV